MYSSTSSTFFSSIKKKGLTFNYHHRKLAEKKLSAFFAKFRISLQNYEKFCNSLRFVYILLCGYWNSGHSLLVQKMSAVSLHCKFLCNFIAFADFYHFSAFSWLENFHRNKSVILNICSVTINEINSYRVQTSCPDSFVGKKVALYSVMMFRFAKIFLTNGIF